MEPEKLMESSYRNRWFLNLTVKLDVLARDDSGKDDAGSTS